MKAICFSVLLVFFSASAIAQTGSFKPLVSPMLQNILLINNDKQSITSSGGIVSNGIIISALDNMPCLVTNLTLIVAIPTSKIVTPHQYIPNLFFKYDTQSETESKLVISK